MILLILNKIFRFIEFILNNVVVISPWCSEEDILKVLFVIVYVVLPICIGTVFLYDHLTRVPNKKPSNTEEPKDADSSRDDFKKEEVDVESLSNKYYADLMSTQNDSIDYEVLTVFILLFIVYAILSYFLYQNVYKNLRDFWRYKMTWWKYKRAAQKAMRKEKKNQKNQKK